MNIYKGYKAGSSNTYHIYDMTDDDSKMTAEELSSMEDEFSDFLDAMTEELFTHNDMDSCDGSSANEFINRNLESIANMSVVYTNRIGDWFSAKGYLILNVRTSEDKTIRIFEIVRLWPVESSREH